MIKDDGDRETATITLSNGGDTIAFFIRAELVKGPDGEEIVPVYYSDNYVSIWPGESVTLTAAYRTADTHGLAPQLRVEGFNVAKTEVAATR